MDMMSKLFDEFGQDSYKERFVFYGFVISSVIALVLCLVKNRHVTPKDMLMGVMLGVPNQLTILFQLKAVGELPAYLVYPCFSAGVILAVNVVNVIAVSYTHLFYLQITYYLPYLYISLSITRKPRSEAVCIRPPTAAHRNS